MWQLGIKLPSLFVNCSHLTTNVNIVINAKYYAAGDKKYTCRLCVVSFSRQKDMDAHLRQHTENLVECRICGEKYKTYNSLQEVSFVCVCVCDVVFSFDAVDTM